MCQADLQGVSWRCGRIVTTQHGKSLVRNYLPLLNLYQEGARTPIPYGTRS